MIGDIDHGQENPQVVLPLQVPYARVDVLRVQPVVFQAEEERTRG